MKMSFWKDKTALVSGGAGFIGSHLVERLASIGCRVTVIDDLSTGDILNIQTILGNIDFTNDDFINIISEELLDLDDFDYVFHLAANPYIPPSVETPAMDFRKNLYLTFLLMEALRNCRYPPRIVNVSSAAVYGNPNVFPIKESDPTMPISPYGVSKLAAERYVSVYCDLFQIYGSSVRLFSVFGPRQKKQVVYDFFTKLSKNPEVLDILGDGSQVRDFVFVGDVVNAILIVAQNAPGIGEVYNVASGVSYSIAELAQLCSQVANLNPRIRYSGNIRPGDAEKWEVDITNLIEIGYSPAISLNEGLVSVRDWFNGL